MKFLRLNSSKKQFHSFTHDPPAASWPSAIKETSHFAPCSICSPPMGGRGRTYSGRGSQKGKGVGAAAKAVAKDATLHLDVLRAYPADDGSIFIHRNGARSDSQLLDPGFLSQIMFFDNEELLNRSAKGLSMLAGSSVYLGCTHRTFVLSTHFSQTCAPVHAPRVSSQEIGGMKQGYLKVARCLLLSSFSSRMQFINA